ncbi:hypothetical protein NQ315_004522 [Exocentrus adspersus]|uniref:Uncharacterized protein n=1 Tax=Exocentrus adspersus TaxID=1586481 RepID=A0AAV8V9W6_9CUCU|nr:hypothetical protein NQ315_004522 [Exocentrus adspersus]
MVVVTLWLYASYIPSKDNWEADQESRILPMDTEWSLAPSAFQTIIQNSGVPTMDLFASKDNKKFPKYYAWFRDLGASAVDAFTVFWGNDIFYAFPQFALILRTLQKITNDQAAGIVLVPYWKTQVWYPLFEKMVVSKPFFFYPHPNLLFSPYSQESHPLSQKLTLVAAVLYDKGHNLYGSFNSHRSALSLVLPGKIGEDPLIKRCLKGVFRLRSSTPRYNVTWDPAQIKLPSDSLKQVSFKLVTLLCLSTGQRLQTISLIEVSNIKRTGSGLQIFIPDLIKTSGPYNSQLCLDLPYFTEKPNLCVASLLNEYLQRTQCYRRNNDFLFLTLQPHGVATKQTLSRWVKT